MTPSQPLSLDASYVWSDPYEGQHDLIQRSWHMNPLSDPASTNLTCNNRGLAVPGTFHASVTAGSTIRTTWVTPDGFGWPHTLGPMAAYMAFCGEDCTTITDTSSLKWFKIAEEGLRAGYAVSEEDGWYQNDLWENRRTEYWNVTVPAGLKPGRYMIRHEIIMLELNPVQFYPNCAHMEVSGGGESVPGDEFLVTFPGAYSLSGKYFNSGGLESERLVLTVSQTQESLFLERFAATKLQRYASVPDTFMSSIHN